MTPRVPVPSTSMNPVAQAQMGRAEQATVWIKAILLHTAAEEVQVLGVAVRLLMERPPTVKGPDGAVLKRSRAPSLFLKCMGG